MTALASRVLIVHGSERGSTTGIAEFMAARLWAQDAVADLRAAAEMPDIGDYDAIVVGSAVHERALLPVVEHFLLRNADLLETKPVWLFTVGVEPSLRGPIGRLMRNAVPPRIAMLCDLIRPRDYHAFAGVVPPARSPLVARALFWLCGGRYGDLRDWPEIEAWTTGIARDLHAAARTR